ncbi:MAG: xanthine dehydrogenase small subunit [Candidatus Sericytochromatia bacterium]
MRDYLLIYLNGQRRELRGAQAFMSLSDYLRDEAGLTGTKVVCAEGDCGACTIVRGRLQADQEGLQYESINSCITFMHLMDCCHILTVEGLGTPEKPNLIQTAMVDAHGTQCGFCTPGFVCAMTAYVHHKSAQCDRAAGETYLEERQLRNALTGNLCRCTGYGPILQAGTSIDLNQFESLNARFDTPEVMADLRQHHAQGVRLSHQNLVLVAPDTLKEAAAFRAEQPDSRIFSSATDLGVLINKDKARPQIITHLARVPEVHALEEQNGQIVVGACVTLNQLEHFCRTRIPEFSRLMRIFASPQIKHKGTLVGNIANASPIADTLPFLFVAEAEIEAFSQTGSRRIPIRDFYTGYKQLALRPDEMISRVYIPIPPRSDLIRLYKVSNRKDLDISTFTAAIRLTLEGQTIRQARIAYGGVGPIVLRLPQTESLLAGKPLSAESFAAAGEQARSEITPISDVRASAAYRYQLAANMLNKFYAELEETVAEPVTF